MGKSIPAFSISTQENIVPVGVLGRHGLGV